MSSTALPFNYRCEAGHVQASQRPLDSCRAMRAGKPCPAPLKRVGPGSRSKSNPTTTTGEPTTMSTTAKSTARKSTTSKVGAVSTKPKVTQTTGKLNTATKPAAKKATAKPAVEKATKVEHPKPAPVAGHTTLKLRSERNAEIIAAHTTTANAISIDGPWVTVVNSKAQALFDELLAAGQSAAIFDRRVLDYFTAMLAIARPTIKDERTSVHAKVLAAGRDGIKSGALKGFAFEQKTDGTLVVNVTDAKGKATRFATQRDALASFI